MTGLCSAGNSFSRVSRRLIDFPATDVMAVPLHARAEADRLREISSSGTTWISGSTMGSGSVGSDASAGAFFHPTNQWPTEGHFAPDRSERRGIRLRQGTAH